MGQWGVHRWSTKWVFWKGFKENLQIEGNGLSCGVFQGMLVALGLQIYLKRIPSQVFWCEYVEILKITYSWMKTEDMDK